MVITVNVNESSILKTLRLKEMHRQNYLNNREHYLAKAKANYAANKDARLAYQSDYYYTHLEQVKERSQRRFETHRVECLAYMKKRYCENREVDREHRLQYNDAHRDEIHAYMYKYVREHPEVGRDYQRRRRAWIVGATENFSDEEFRLKCSAYDNRCIYCNAETQLVADHATPLSRGGSDAIDNIVPACSACNNKKHIMTYDEFVETLDEKDRMRLLIEDYIMFNSEVLEEEVT